MKCALSIAFACEAYPRCTSQLETLSTVTGDGGRCDEGHSELTGNLSGSRGDFLQVTFHFAFSGSLGSILDMARLQCLLHHDLLVTCLGSLGRVRARPQERHWLLQVGRAQAVWQLSLWATCLSSHSRFPFISFVFLFLVSNNRESRSQTEWPE